MQQLVCSSPGSRIPNGRTVFANNTPKIPGVTCKVENVGCFFADSRVLSINPVSLKKIRT